MTDLEIYRVQDAWKQRRGVTIRGARRWWMRTWQAEWPDCRRAVRAYTRNGVLVKAVRCRMHDAARAKEGL